MYGKDLRSKSLSVAFGGATALHPTDLDVEAGEILAVTGPSGSAKTTLLRTLAGHVVPTVGRVLIGGDDVTGAPPERRPSLFVSRDLALFPALDVAENVAFGLEARGVGRGERRQRAEALLDLVGLAGLAAHSVTGLPRETALAVALARALAIEPAVLLLDEPFAGLEPEARRRARALLARLHRRFRPTIVHATADPTEAVAFADRVAVLVDGRPEQIAPPDRLWSEPATLSVARHMGPQNLLAGRVVAVAGTRLEVETGLGLIRATARAPLAVGDPVEVTIRPERILLATDRDERGRPGADPAGWNALRGDLVGRTLEGASVAYDFAVGDTRLVIVQPNLGPGGLLLANLHAFGFHAEEALAFPAPAAAAGEGAP